ncbi:MAG TPA: hypothetical protein VGB03_09055 [Acidimicrobiales bacterium]
MTVPAGAARWAGIGAAVLLVAGATAAVVLDDDGAGEQVATDATTSSTEEPTTTTSTTVAPSSTTSITASILKVTSTTAKPATTTTAPKAPAFTISPTSGPEHTQVTARGAGCTGANAGVSITHYTPSGKPYNGDGGSAQPDGTWQQPLSIGAPEGPGRYKLVAECTGGDRRFTYAPQYFTVTG